MIVPRSLKVILLMFVFVTPSLADEHEEKKSEKPDGDKPAVHVVEAAPFRSELTLDGVVVAREMAEITLRPESWSDFTVEEAVAHGTHVNKGDVLIRFDPRKLAEALTDMEAAQRLTELSVQQADEALAQSEKSLLLTYQAAQRDQRNADEDYRRFLDIDRPLSEKSAEFSLKMSENQLSYVEEELRQLEKMYEADDLTEETEEIILKRQRDAVERSRFSLEQARVRRDRTMQITLPRQDESLRHAQESAKLALDKAETTRSYTLDQSRIELAKKKEAQKRSRKEFERATSDRELMIIRAPVDGVVYYGRCVDGKWSEIAAMTAKLRRDGKLTASSVPMTIVQMEPVYVRCTVPEKDIEQIKAGMKAQVALASDGHQKTSAEVESVTDIPGVGGTFAAKLALGKAEDGPRRIPGMTCKATIVTYEKSDALAVPATAVSTDPEDSSQQIVSLVVDDDKTEKRRVKVGHRSNDQVEIVDGLEAGDKMLVKNPAAKEEAKK